MKVHEESNVQVISCLFQNGVSLQGGAIFQIGTSSLYISNSIFDTNFAKDSGGAIYSASFINLKIDTNTVFVNNRATVNGDSIYAINC